MVPAPKKESRTHLLVEKLFNWYVRARPKASSTQQPTPNTQSQITLWIDLNPFRPVELINEPVRTLSSTA